MRKTTHKPNGYIQDSPRFKDKEHKKPQRANQDTWTRITKSHDSAYSNERAKRTQVLIENKIIRLLIDAQIIMNACRIEF